MTMTNAEQIEYWNGDAGRRWAEEDDTMAQLLRPISEALIAYAKLDGCRSALDIGCGGGSQSVMLADELGEGARVTGVDISQPMLAVAEDKAAAPGHGRATMEFVQADAATYEFVAEEFDLIFSRFGVMFFDEPVGAFTNIRPALQSDGRVVFCCWQPVKANDWTRIPLQAALQHVPAPAQADPNAPGPFAFSDPERVQNILQSSGFTDISVEPYSTSLHFGKTATLAQSVRELAMIGPVSRLLVGQEADVLEKVFDSMEEVLSPHYRDGTLSLTGAVWFVTATT
ncbi:MAG: methyltransferase domain-containing protein [Halioglobus sp.]